MKTLDEVIAELEDEGVFADALHYLKEYKIKRERIMAKAQDCAKHLQAEVARYQEAIKNCELAENKYKRLYEETSQNFADTSQITCPKCHSEFVILDDPDGDHAQLLKCQALLQDFYRNDPLDWETLKQMEGKPVWVEPVKEWMLITEIEPEDGAEHIWLLSLDGFDYDMGCYTDWIYYRKERE